MTTCKICGRRCETTMSLSQHIRIHGIDLISYSITHEGFKIPKCEFCENDSKHCSGLLFRRTCGKSDCVKRLQKMRRHSDETKNKIRELCVKRLQTEKAGSPWDRRASGKMSYLEQWFFDSVITENKLFDNFDIVNEFCEYPYFIDFAFLNIKLAVELDGRCHFQNGTERIEHDSKKDKHLVQSGWTVYRIRYDQRNQDSIDEFLRFISEFDKHKGKVLGSKVYKYREVKKRSRTRREYFSQKKEKYLNQQKERIVLVSSSGIDFSKYGWVSKVASLINMSPQKVSKWMSQVLPDIYEKSFKRS